MLTGAGAKRLVAGNPFLVRKNSVGKQTGQRGSTNQRRYQMLQ